MLNINQLCGSHLLLNIHIYYSPYTHHQIKCTGMSDNEWKGMKVIETAREADIF